jgi:mannose-6-phosphate isomerase-like protein (cupin superfamily)
MGMRWEVTRSTADTAGELFETTNWLDPQMPGPPTHVHPNSEESFEVIEGSLEVFIDGEWTTVGPGDTATVPPNMPHTLRNASDEAVKTITRIRPAGDSEELFRSMHRLIEEQKIKRLPPKEPRSAIYAAMLFSCYPGEIRVTGPLKGVFKALTLIGRGLRFKL